ncbi:MAG: tRNA (N6-isopentenyl adenosine(37)-C2)-methylthiotransferase MiaB [Betaproteobacteria bacterium]|nr:tRNA (N6-isopentenyl adenosine(37)-C2)-methylthiotransferase MiaB [Betaproteobacteria bacterium]
MTNPKKLFLRTFGCQMNEYDSDKMADVLNAAEGYELTERPEDADLILFNTCSVRERAQERVFHDLGRIRHLKLANPDLLIGVGGCVASQEGKAIVSRAPFVDIVFGPQTLHRLPELLAARRSSGKSQVDISFPEIEKFDHLPAPRAAGPTAFVSIMEGCSKYCSFCVVPYTRGEEVSRPIGDVLNEIAALALSGVKEVTLLGQNVNAYRDQSCPTIEDCDFTLLLDHVAELPGIDRIRYTTSHPRDFTARLIDAHARIANLAAHVHLPVQSGSDRILAAMKRGYTTLEYKSIVRRLRAARPDISIGTDIIVGFPGETESDFEATLALVDDIGFDASYSFLYSPRPGTPAAELADATPHQQKLDRLYRLQKKLDQLEMAIGERMVGSTQSLLIESRSAKDPGELAGRTSNNRMVNFPGDAALIGRFKPVRIIEARRHSLRGELTPAAAVAI